MNNPPYNPYVLLKEIFWIFFGGVSLLTYLLFLFVRWEFRCLVQIRSTCLYESFIGSFPTSNLAHISVKILVHHFRLHLLGYSCLLASVNCQTVLSIKYIMGNNPVQPLTCQSNWLFFKLQFWCFRSQMVRFITGQEEAPHLPTKQKPTLTKMFFSIQQIKPRF